jgi:hypothetical protein
MAAQGNALGRKHRRKSRPERALQDLRHYFVLPLQGKCIFGQLSQGVALGCHVVALSARRTRASDTHLRTHQSFGLKAREMAARDNALGREHRRISCRERALQDLRHYFVLPLQGKCIFGRLSQGVALGCHVVAPSARRTRASDTHPNGRSFADSNECERNPNGIQIIQPRVAESAMLPWVNRRKIVFNPIGVGSCRYCGLVQPLQGCWLVHAHPA